MGEGVHGGRELAHLDTGVKHPGLQEPPAVVVDGLGNGHVEIEGAVPRPDPRVREPAPSSLG